MALVHDPDFTITGKGDGYIFMVGADAGTTDQGNLIFATGDTGTQNKIIFAAGGLSSDNSQMTITPDQNIHIEIATPSTSPTTGALTVAGGVGIVGDVNIQGEISFGGAGTTVESANLSVVDPMVYVGSSNSADAIDMGLVGKYVTGGNTRYSGVVRDASDGVMKFFENATTKPLTTVNFAESGLAYADIKVDAIEAASATIGDVSNTEIQYLNGVSSSIQTQINSKLSSSTAASTYAPITDATLLGTVTLPSTTAIGDVSATELQYLSTVTSNVQTQIDAKLDSSTATSTYATKTGGVITRPVLTSAFEKSFVSATQATGVMNIDLGNSAVHYFTGNAAADFTFNVRWDGATTLNSVLGIGESATIAVLVTNGSTAYKPAASPGAFQVDGVTVTPKWQGGTAPSAGNASSVDSYTFTIIKTASATYTVLAAQVKFA